MTTKVEIYQVRNDIDERHDISFMDYSYVTKVIPNLKRDLKNYYEKVYEYEEDFENHTDESTHFKAMYNGDTFVLYYNINALPEDLKADAQWFKEHH
jgi:hypothetical protein